MKRPKATDYNLQDIDSLVNYISDWNECYNLMQMRIYELEEINKKLRSKLLVHKSEIE